MDRRTFLKTTGFGTVGLALGGVAFRVGGFWWDQSPGDGFKVLSGTEARIVNAIAEAMFPGDDREPYPMPSGAHTDLDVFFDDYLASIPEITSKLLRVLLHAIDDVSVFADFGLARFHTRPLAERTAILNAWDTSRVGARRGAFRSIKMLLGMGYCEHPGVLQAAGINFSCGGEV